METLRRRRVGARPTLSVVCGTHHPGAVVAAALEPLRAVADEIVVGADDRVGAADLRWYGSVADRLVTYPYIGPNRHRGWLQTQASGDWILFVDGDEVPSQELIDGLPALLAARHLAGYRLRRWWLAPDGRHLLDEWPWSPEYQCRLVRNDDRLWFPSVKHSGPASRGPVRRIEPSLIHLALALEDLDERHRKVDRYDAEHFGHLTGGRPTNALYYLPERRQPPPATRPLEAADLARVAAALRPGAAVPPRRRSGVQAGATGRDLRRATPWEPFDPEDARAAISVLRCPDRTPAGVRFEAEVQVGNRGGRSWPWGAGASPAIRVAYHWRHSGQDVVFDGLRTPLPHPVAPGGDATVTCTIQAPDEGSALGSWSLAFDVVAEGDRWFGCETTVAIELTTGMRELLLGARRDGLVPLDAALEARTRLEPAGQLEAIMGDPAPGDALPDPLARLLDGLTIGGWSLDRGALHLVSATFAATDPGTTVEFGSGTSTVLLAGLAGQASRGSRAVVSFEQDPAHAARVREELAERGLDAVAAVVLAPLTAVEVGGITLQCYDPAVVAAALEGRSIDLVLIDGPSQEGGGSRYPTLALVQPNLRQPARFLLDDAWRDEELTAAEHWSRRAGVTIDGIAPVGKGALVGSIRPA